MRPDTHDTAHAATHKLTLVLLATLLMSGIACRSKLEVKTAGSSIKAAAVIPDEPKADEPTGTPVPIAIDDAFTSRRLFFQSRSVISVNIASNIVEPDERFSLVNETTKAVLVDQQPLSFGLQNEAYLAGAPSYQVSVQFYPMDEKTAGRFAYGANLLRLMVEGDTPKTAEHSIYMKDFTVMGMQLSHFEMDTQRQDGFQGEISTMTNRVVGNGKGFLISGFMNLVNQ